MKEVIKRKIDRLPLAIITFLIIMNCMRRLRGDYSGDRGFVMRAYVLSY
jgi:hypothetical protein